MEGTGALLEEEVSAAEVLLKYVKRIRETDLIVLHTINGL